MLSPTTKEAIKVALAFTSAIVLALLFGWEKPYWAAVTVVTLASNESFSHSIQAAQNRILGTLVGAGAAIALVAFFAQDRLLFIGTFLLLAGVCTLMSYDRKYGYLYRIAFVVCALISFMGSFDDAISVNMVFLRLQETLLGVVVFTLVFRFLWPVNSEVDFYEQQSNTTDKLTQLVAELTECINGKQEVSTDKIATYQGQLVTLENSIKSQSFILDLPGAGSCQLSQQRKHWKKLTIASYETVEALQSWIKQASDLLDQMNAKSERSSLSLQRELAREATIIQLIEQLSVIQSTVRNISSARDELHHSLTHINNDSERFSDIKVRNTWQQVAKQWNTIPPIAARVKDALIVVLTLATSFAMWIYIPLPNGYMFPMLSAVLAINLIAMPKVIVNQALVGLCVSGALVLLQYTFIMPRFTEVWQLAGFYFINLVIIWRVCATPQLAVQKIIAANLLVVLTMSALYLTPSYDITGSLNMFVQVFLALGVIRFFVAWCKE